MSVAKMKMNQKNKLEVLIALVIMALVSSVLVQADPEGGTVTFITNSTKAVTAASSRQDPKGTITTITLNSVQQNVKWKAYIGNVTGTLVLRDADDYSIYEWSAIASPSGEVYITRNSSVDWSTIQCANTTNIQTEQTSLGHGGSASDNIVNTFGSTTHQAIGVAGYTIAQSTCKSAFPWVNNTAQTPSISAIFQEVLLMDASYRIVYTSVINQDKSGYRNDTIEDRTDFEAIVPDFASISVATYYFYVEIDG